MPNNKYLLNAAIKLFDKTHVPSGTMQSYQADLIVSVVKAFGVNMWRIDIHKMRPKKFTVQQRCVFASFYKTARDAEKAVKLIADESFKIKLLC